MAARPERQANGDLLWDGLLIDISARKRAEEALRESEARLRAVFEKAAIGIGLVDMEGRFVKNNPAMRAMLGYSEEELSGKMFTALTHAEDRTTDWGLFRELLEGKQDHYQREKRYIRKDGGLIWVHLTVSLIRGVGGEPQFAVGLVENITERKRAEEAISWARQVAETLASSTRDLASSLQRDQVLQRLVEHARRLTSSDLSYIAVQEGAAHEYRICAESGAWTEKLLGLRVGAGRGLGGVALATGAPACTDNYLYDPRLGQQYHGVIRGEDIVSQAVVPVRAGTEIIALLYHYRWLIEIFFRFFKQILGCRHLLSHSQNGIEIQTYCAIIASMLISLWTGKKPTLRTYEMICFYFTGLASEDELVAHIDKLKKQDA